MLSFLLLEEMSSRVWELNKKMHHNTAKYVLKVYIKCHFVLVFVWDIGISNYVMETGVILFDSLYITTALLYFILLLTESQSSSWNIKTDGVSK